MAIDALSTTVPAVQAGLLPFTFRPVPPVDDSRSAVELLDEIRRTIEGQEFHDRVAKPELPPEPLLSAYVRHDVARGHMSTTEDTGSADRCSTSTVCSAAMNYPDMVGVVADRPDEIRLADAARTLHLRRQLAEAAEHGVALLAALGLPRLVEPDFVSFDIETVGDALDTVIATLDAVDGDTDIEDGADDELTGDDELTLGWTNIVRQTDLGWSYDDAEPLLGAPERHPYVYSLNHPYYEPANGSYYRAKRCESQVSWAQGRGSEDGEAEPGYDLPEGDHELDDDGIYRGEEDNADYEGTAPERHGKGFVRCGPDDAEDGHDAETVYEDGSEDEPYGWRFQRPSATSSEREVVHAGQARP